MFAGDFGKALLLRAEGEIVEGRTGKRLAGAELRMAGAAAATYLSQAMGSSSGPVLMILELTLESVIAYLGALASGRPVVPVDVRDWQQKKASLLEAVRPAGCWLPRRILPDNIELPANMNAVYGLPDIIGRGNDSSILGLHTVCSLEPGVRVMIPTSGSTGRPSLVQVSDLNLFTNTLDIISSQGLTCRDKALLCLPLSYCFGASVLHTHLWAGGSVVVDDRLMFPDKVLNVMESEGCTTFAGVPTTFLHLQNHSSVLRRRFPSLRLWLQAGGHLAAPVVNAFRAAHSEAGFMVMYGQTEATARIASFLVDSEYPAGCVGYPLPSLEVQIRTDSGDVCGAGIQGAIWIRGHSVCMGYLNDPIREAERFVSGWLNTGDIGRLLPDGRLSITGRSDGFIKVRGRRVSSQEVEDLVWKLFAARSCACPVSDPASGEVIGLILEPPPGDAGMAANELSTDAKAEYRNSKPEVSPELRQRLRAALPPHWDLGPVVVAVLPITVNGKVDRMECRTRLLQVGEGPWN
ncbi:class I adenylate-forming enzyme family protein [Noviherbaspirillum autotrophicum]|uniref:class I adenylate-forming enzyme family protein n=1 Tax=Noviherbaspirillum autotrophicum TaxID=709839 RepID=UPI00069364DA|nr:class I adenylate-forming enzyme family protein [Noviherbaspirillum autotrophicum]